MPDLINVTYARNNFSQMIDEVMATQQPKILIRESQPQVVLIPYAEYERKEKNWSKFSDDLFKEGKRKFKAYCAKNNIKYPKTEKQMYAVADKISGRA
jgi:prevent-host-death family protein